MNKDIKTLWLENLSNGKYLEMDVGHFPSDTSGDLPLRWKNLYTPLGVLCDMYAKSFELKNCWKYSLIKSYPEWKAVEFMGSNWCLPSSVYTWAWMRYDLSKENTIWNMGFKEASEYIAKQL